MTKKNFYVKFYFYQQLDIVQNYYPKQFKRKLMKGTRQVQKNIIYAYIWSVSFEYGPQNLFQDVYFQQELDIVQNCHTMQFKGKLINQTTKNGKIDNSGHNFGFFDLNLCAKDFNMSLSSTSKQALFQAIILGNFPLRKTNEPNFRKQQKN